MTTDTAEDHKDKTRKLFSAKTLPIRYMVTPKCGCTFVKNLLWYLDHGALPVHPLSIHDQDDKFARASDFGLTTDQICSEEFAFMAIRKPVDRFFSLYAEKIMGHGQHNFVPLKKVLVENHGLDPFAVTVNQHEKNCKILIRWLQANLMQKIDIRPDDHWTPQHYRSFVYRPFDLKVLLVSQLSDQIALLLCPLVPNIDDIIQGIERNPSPFATMKKDIMSPTLRQEVNEVYRQDWELFFAAKDAWAKGIERSEDIPRVSDLKIRVRTP
ncbi:MAG: sulfotransferase family 2 domain-containing protein [Planktomarina sp.]